MKLLLDAGNSRVKWSYLSAAGISRVNAASYEAFVEACPLRVDTADNIEAIYLLSVTAGNKQVALQAEIERCCGITPVLLHTQQRLGETVNGYLKPEQLGVDRWAAIVGAQGIADGPVCVVDCGTAVTVDAVTRSGRHLGGYIMPGLSLQQQMLRDATARIDTAGQLQGQTWGRDTATAVARGPLEAITGAIERSLEQLEHQQPERACVILTGGDADRVESLLRCAVERVDDLVFRGMARMINSGWE